MTSADMPGYIAEDFANEHIFSFGPDPDSVDILTVSEGVR
jgi:hypothetical protein